MTGTGRAPRARGAWPLAAGCLLWACATTPERPAPREAPPAHDAELGRYLDEVGQGVDRTRAARNALVSRAPDSVPFLIRSLEDGRFLVRFEVVQALDQVGDPRAIPALVKRTVVDESNHVRYRVLPALSGMIGKAPELRREVIEELRRWHASQDARERWNATYALAGFEVRDVLPEVEEALGSEAPWRRFEAIWALKSIHEPRHAELLAPLLTSLKRPRVWDVIDTLDAIPGEAADRILTGALDHPDAEVRKRAARSLERRKREAAAAAPPIAAARERKAAAGDEPGSDEPARSRGAPDEPQGASLDELRAKLRDPSPYRRWEAVSDLGARRAEAAVPDILEAIAAARDSSGDWHLLWRSIWAIKNMPDRALVEAEARAAFARQKEWRPRWNLAVTLCHLALDEPEAVAAVLEAISSPRRPDYRVYGITALAWAASETLFEVAEQFIGSRQARERSAVLDAVQRWPAGDPRVVPLLARLLDDPSSEIRWRAAMYLGRRGAGAVAPLEARLPVEEDSNVRHHIQQSLERLRGSR